MSDGPKDRYEKTHLLQQQRKMWDRSHDSDERSFRVDLAKEPLICSVCGAPIVPLPDDDAFDNVYMHAVMYVVDGEKRYKHEPKGCAAVFRRRRRTRSKE